MSVLHFQSKGYAVKLLKWSMMNDLDIMLRKRTILWVEVFKAIQCYVVDVSYIYLCEWRGITSVTEVRSLTYVTYIKKQINK